MKLAKVSWAGFSILSLAFSLPAHAAIENPAFNRGVLAIAITLAYIIFTLWIYKRHRRRLALPAGLQGRTDNSETVESSSQPLNQASSQTAKPAPTMLVAYASQSGHARELAIKTALSLQESGIHARCFSLDEVDSQLLQTIPRALFVVSTTGEGDAPDNARGFVHKHMNLGPGQALDLAKLQYGILALGDSSYQYFCGFAHALDGWLQHVHALPMFDLVQVDGDDPGALRHWQYQLGLLAHNAEMADWQAPQYDSWRLVMRQQLNPGSVAGAVYHLGLKPEQPGARWQAGDIAEIGPRNSAEAVAALMAKLGLSQSQTAQSEPDSPVNLQTLAQSLSERLLPHDEHELAKLAGMSAQTLLQTLKPLPHREYSIASLPGDGQLELVIRQTHYADGRPGLGSGWLTQFANLGEKVALRIRENPAFHPPAAEQRLILIGNGTGIAGLRAHLKARAANSSAPSWLLFGERQQAHDYYFQTEINAWFSSGVLARVDAVFSRDQAEKAYVQHVLAEHAETLREWVAQGAVVYVCGSASGMAPAVHNVLLHALGEPLLTEMALHGRYRRDVY